MDQNFTTAMAGVLGSVSGASAAIATTWISQKSQTVSERAKWETRKRETPLRRFYHRSIEQMITLRDVEALRTWRAEFARAGRAQFPLSLLQKAAVIDNQL